MSKGSVVLVPFPFTDLSGQKVRPAVVLSTQKKVEDCIVIFISSKKEKRIEAFDVPIKATLQNGLKLDSLIKVNKIATLQKKIVLGELGTLEPATLQSIDQKLKELFQLK